MISESILKLIELQEVLAEMKRLDDRLVEIPVEMGKIEKTISTAEKERQDLLDKIEEHNSSMRLAEGEIELLKEKQLKFKEQLMAVKTNNEYRSLLSEIDSAKSRISGYEDEMLEKMEGLEALQKELSEKEDFFNNEKVRIDSEKEELAKEIKVLELQKADLETKSLIIEKDIPAPHINVFKRICAARGGVAISRAVGESCTECMMHIRPQLFQEVKKAEDLVLCENCKRILYWIDDDDDSDAVENSGSEKE